MKTCGFSDLTEINMINSDRKQYARYPPII